MSAWEQKRRSFLLGLSGLGMSQILLRKGITQALSVARQGYVLPASGGEHLIHFRDQGKRREMTSESKGRALLAFRRCFAWVSGGVAGSGRLGCRSRP